jgi:lipopolysaccharide export system protein LptA
MSDKLSIYIDKNSKTGFPGISSDNESNQGGENETESTKSPDNPTEPSPVESIEKIIAEGNVVIITNTMHAKTDRAVYTTKDRILILTGKSSKIENETEKGEKNYVKGSKITFNVADGVITVDSGNNNPVEAIFYPDGKGLNLQ